MDSRPTDIMMDARPLCYACW